MKSASPARRRSGGHTRLQGRGCPRISRSRRPRASRAERNPKPLPDLAGASEVDARYITGIRQGNASLCQGQRIFLMATNPRFLRPDLLQPSGRLAHSSRKRTLRPRDPVRYQRRYTAGPRQVHDRLSLIQSLREGTPRTPLRHDAAARAASQTRAPRGSPRHRTGRPPGGGRRAPGHRLRGSLDGTARADPAACPGRRYEQDQPAAHHEQNGGEPAPRDGKAFPSQTSSPGARIMGQNGRGSAEQAVPRTAPSARTLSAICP